MALENGEQKDKKVLDCWWAAILLQAGEIESGESEP